jgi:hypothetical protein
MVGRTLSGLPAAVSLALGVIPDLDDVTAGGSGSFVQDVQSRLLLRRTGPQDTLQVVSRRLVTEGTKHAHEGVDLGGDGAVGRIDLTNTQVLTPQRTVDVARAAGDVDRRYRDHWGGSPIHLRPHLR